MAKKIKVPCTGARVELQEDRNLFALMMVTYKSQPEIDIKEAVGTNEFRVVPRSMFAADGTTLYCPAKSALRSCQVAQTSVELLARKKSVPSNKWWCLSSMQWLRYNPLTSPSRYATACTLVITLFLASVKSMETVIRSYWSLIDMMSQHP